MKCEQLWRWSLVGSLILIGGAMVAQTTRPVNATLAQIAPSAEPVAVVDLERLIDLLDERTKREKDLQALGTSLETRVNEMRQRLRDKIDERETASESRRGALFEEIVRLQTSLDAEQEYASRIAGELLTRLKRDLYRKVLGAVKQYSESEGYAIVLSDDSAADLPNDGGLQALELAMMSRKVLYARPTVDITEEVARRMNADYASSAGNR